MTSGYGITSALVEERIEQLLDLASTVEYRHHEPGYFTRLAAAALTLVQQHTVDGKGRCSFCTRRRRWRRVRIRPCTVYSAFSSFLTQPDDLVQRHLTELMGHHHAADVAAQTMPMPQIGDR